MINWYFIFIIQYNGTLLLISCLNGQVNIVEKLLQLGADVNAVDEVSHIIIINTIPIPQATDIFSIVKATLIHM